MMVSELLAKIRDLESERDHYRARSEQYAIQVANLESRLLDALATLRSIRNLAMERLVQLGGADLVKTSKMA
jgi:hypothetical protein